MMNAERADPRLFENALSEARWQTRAKEAPSIVTQRDLLRARVANSCWPFNLATGRTLRGTFTEYHALRDAVARSGSSVPIFISASQVSSINAALRRALATYATAKTADQARFAELRRTATPSVRLLLEGFPVAAFEAMSAKPHVLVSTKHKGTSVASGRHGN